MITYTDALARLLQQVRLPMETVTLSQAHQRVMAAPVTSPVALPSCALSAMDGFALRSEQLRLASVDHPVRLRVIGCTLAGEPPAQPPADQLPGSAWAVMTGAPLPVGYDAVIKIEQCQVHPPGAQWSEVQDISLTEPVAAGDCIRPVGADIQPGDLLVPAGTLIQAEQIMALAAVGTAQLKVVRTPRVSVLITGQEVREATEAGPLPPGCIYNANGPYLMAALQRWPVAAVYLGNTGDDPQRFEQVVQQALKHSDLILSTGAVSMGQQDFILHSLVRLGAQIGFHRVQVRPAKPVLYARFAQGAQYLGLPGNPVSAAVGLRFFVWPLLQRLLGLPDEPVIHLPLAEPYATPPGWRLFCKARIVQDAQGQQQVHILPGQASFQIKSLLQANAWACFSEARQGDASPVQVYSLWPEHTEGVEYVKR